MNVLASCGWPFVAQRLNTTLIANASEIPHLDGAAFGKQTPRHVERRVSPALTRIRHGHRMFEA